MAAYHRMRRQDPSSEFISALIVLRQVLECDESSHRSVFALRLVSISSAALSFSRRCGLLGRLRLTAFGAIAVKQYAVCPSVAYERMQIVRQLLIIQQCRHQTFALCGAMQNFPRIANCILQTVGGLFR